MEAWRGVAKESVTADSRAFGPPAGRQVLEQAVARPRVDPVTPSRNLKLLRRNRFAQRELRLMGRYRVLFNVDVRERTVTILLAGEKRRNALYVQGERFTAHHEDRSLE